MPNHEKLSVAIITLNEERNLARCLDSVSWVDDIVVVDSGSADRTVEIAREHGAKVFTRTWDGFVNAKNSALDEAEHAWVLSLDADEWLTGECADEIRRVLRSPQADAYALNRLSAFCGGFMRRTWSPDWVVRLFRKDRGRFEGGLVHEHVGMAPGSRIERLPGRLLHLSYRSMEEYMARMNRYSSLAALSLAERGRKRKGLLVFMLLSPLADFIKTYLLKQGFRDGIRGLIVSAGASFYVFLKYAKLWEHRRPTDPELKRLAAPTADDPDPTARQS